MEFIYSHRQFVYTAPASTSGSIIRQALPHSLSFQEFKTPCASNLPPVSFVTQQ